MKKKVLIASYDAGGAEILSNWLKYKKPKAFVVVDGPAKKIFKKNCPNVKFDKLDYALSKSDWVLCSTGWSSNFELNILTQAKKLKKKSVAFLDHWVNYLDRFKSQNKKYIFPDEIWVGDLHAKKIATSIFKNIPVIQKKNPYFHHIILKIRSMKKKKKNKKLYKKVLYVSEPIKDHINLKNKLKKKFYYNEHDALRYFLRNLHRIDKNIEEITLRPHPSEKIKKYNWIKKLDKVKINFSKNKSLLEDILYSDIVVGCETMAMVIALLAKKRVVTSIPPNKKFKINISLPYKKIEKIPMLISKNK